MSQKDQLRLRLTRRERDLISEYGYPFEELSAQLADAEAKRGRVTLTTDSFYLDHLLGELVRSAKELDDRHILVELDALYEELEVQARRQGHR